MYQAFLPALILSLLLSQPTGSQVAPPTSPEDVIARYVLAVGGMERIEAVHTLTRTGTFYGEQGFEAKVVQENMRPNLVRQEFTFGGMTGVTAYDGKSGWKIEPWQGKKDPEALGEEELKSVLEDADFDGPFLNAAQKGNKLEYLGVERVEGDDTYKLKVVLASGDVAFYYFDAEFNVPIKIERKRLVRGAEREYETTLGDYKLVNGWYLPFSVETGAKGSPARQRLTIQSIVANLPLDDSRFARPSGAGASSEVQGQAMDASEVLPKTAGPTQGAAAAGASRAHSVPATQATAAATGASTPPPGAQAVGGGSVSTGAAATPPAERRGDTPAASNRVHEAVRFDSDSLAGLGARNIGSATMSGRIAAVTAVHEGARLTIYVGAASGGVWKSVNGGTTFKPVFDKQPVQSIGALAVDSKNPQVVWVGTGEAWTRNSASIGDGVYKSTNGGDDWTNVGLPDSERIAKILIDPTATETVYVCVPGKLWSDSSDRGVYKTTDGGVSWSKVLAGGNLSTGCSMLAMDTNNPAILYAGMWDFRRKGWTFRSGGDGPEAPSASGLWKSMDGGASWRPLDDKSAPGLPTKPWGRVAVSVAPSNPEVVYAFIEAEPPKNGLYRSSDGGKTWEARDRSQSMIWRPFYFAHLIIDPKDEDKLYKPNLDLIASNDGGKSFTSVGGGAHGDFHDVWIDPKNTDHLIAGDDGGLWYSYDGANKWWKADNLPVSQFYHVSVDMERPYHVYGGLQDNSSWVGDSAYPGGISNDRWENMYGGDGFWMFVDPSDPDYIYAESQGGEVGRVHRKTHEIRSLKPLPGYREGKLRFNWNAPIHIGPSGAVYIGAQFLFRTTDQGQTWQRISPDLTTNDPQKQKQEQSGGVTVDNSSAEMHTTIHAIAESPKNAQVIWVGTDDGNLQVTRDSGGTWNKLVTRMTGLPKHAWVSSLEASRFEEGGAFATFDLHTFGDMRPYAYETTDYGQTWRSLIPTDAPVRGYAHVLRQDSVNADLLFLGTELGLWISVDRGKHWAQYKGGDLPSVAVRDLVVHPRENDLVIATHGRGIWIVDDMTPLRALTPAVLAQDVAFVQTAPAVQRVNAFGGGVDGDAKFTGPNPSAQAVITYYQRRRHLFGDLTIDVRDSSGKVVGIVPSSKRRGLNRVFWSMRMPAPKSPPAATAGVALGPRLLPGTYTVTMTKDRNTYTTPLQVITDPRVTHSASDRDAQFALATRVYKQFADMTYAVEKINRLRAQLGQRAAGFAAADSFGRRLRAASSQLDELRKKIVATTEGGMITGEERLREHLQDLYFGVTFYEGAPTRTQIERADALARELADVVASVDAWATKELPAINAELTRRKLEGLELLEREGWEAVGTQK